MGYAIQWILFDELNPSNVAERMGFSLTEEESDVPDTDALAVLSGGRSIIWLNNQDPLQRSALGSLSRDTTLLHQWVDEHVMSSSASWYEEGALVWHVDYDAEENRLRAWGPVPDAYYKLRSAVVDGGRSDDPAALFDIPVGVANAVSGFRYDQDTVDRETAWTTILLS